MSAHPSGGIDTWEPMGVATFTVHASWLSDSEVTDDAVLNVNRTFRPQDEGVCTWVDRADPRRFLVSFDVESDNYESAARDCLAAIVTVPQIEPRLSFLEEVGVTDEEGYILVGADDFDHLQHLAD